MIHTLTIQVTPEEEADEQRLKSLIAEKLVLSTDSITGIKKLKRSIDARSRTIKIQIHAEVYVGEALLRQEYRFHAPSVADAQTVLIVGAGPAGLFAALRLIEGGFKPVILERGKDVKARRRDLAAINREHIVNPDSNYCFGEGGAGTYSDGKLYTRSTKRGDVKKVLELLVAHGAADDILVEAHPHIGTNKLPQIIVNIRERIINAGGEVHFNTRVTDFLIRNNSIQGVVAADGRHFHLPQVCRHGSRRLDAEGRRAGGADDRALGLLDDHGHGGVHDVHAGVGGDAAANVRSDDTNGVLGHTGAGLDGHDDAVEIDLAAARKRHDAGRSLLDVHPPAWFGEDLPMDRGPCVGVEFHGKDHPLLIAATCEGARVGDKDRQIESAHCR